MIEDYLHSFADYLHGCIVVLSRRAALADTVNPSWPSHIIVSYYFEVVQEMNIKIYHK
jgi:hypothetical protein